MGNADANTPHTDLRDYLSIFAPLALIVALYFPTLQQIATICWNDEDYSHGLILPIISLYLIVTKRQELGASFGQSTDRTGAVTFSWTGLALLIAGGLTYLLGSVSQLMFVNWASFFLSAIGALQLTLGTRTASAYLAPILLLFMAKPIPDSLVPKLFWPLQVLAAKISAWVLHVADVPVYLTGNIIEIPGMKLMVEEACSGIRSMMALLTVAFIVMLIVPMSRLGMLFVFLISIATAIILNVVRVAATGVLAYFYDKDAASGFFHTFSGMVVFIVGLVVVYSVSSWVSKRSGATLSTKGQHE